MLIALSLTTRQHFTPTGQNPIGVDHAPTKAEMSLFCLATVVGA